MKLGFEFGGESNRCDQTDEYVALRALDNRPTIKMAAPPGRRDSHLDIMGTECGGKESGAPPPIGPSLRLQFLPLGLLVVR